MRFSFDVGRAAPAVVAMFVPVMELMAGFLPANQSPEFWLMGRLLDLRLGIDGLLLPSKPCEELVRGGMSAAAGAWKLESERVGGRFWWSTAMVDVAVFRLAGSLPYRAGAACVRRVRGWSRIPARRFSAANAGTRA